MPDNSSDSTACIVGAGPAGLLLALLLGRGGHRVTVLERSPRIDLTGQAGAPVLQPVTLRILERAGLLEQVRAGAGEIRSGEVHVPGQQTVQYAYADLPDVPVPFALTVPVNTLRGTLLEALEELPNVDVRLGTSVVELGGEPGGHRSLTVQDREGTHRLRTQFVVGCDGKFSTVRELSQIPTEVFTYDKGYLDFVVPAPPGWSSRITMHFGEDAYLLTMPYPGDQLIVVWITTEQRVSSVLRQPFAQLADELVQCAPELEPVFSPEVAHTGWDELPHRQVQHHMVRPERWLDGNVLLIGDSAHAMHAFGGQGLNTSLQDAAWAAEGIDQAVAGGGSTELLQELLRRRVPFIEAFQEMQRQTLAPLPGERAEQHGDALPDFLPMALGQPELRELWTGAPEGALR